MNFDPDLRESAARALKAAVWCCQECGSDMPVEFEEDNEDETGYFIIGATCPSCETRYDRDSSEQYGLGLDESSTAELLGL